MHKMQQSLPYQRELADRIAKRNLSSNGEAVDLNGRLSRKATAPKPSLVVKPQPKPRTVFMNGCKPIVTGEDKPLSSIQEQTEAKRVPLHKPRPREMSKHKTCVSTHRNVRSYHQKRRFSESRIVQRRQSGAVNLHKSMTWPRGSMPPKWQATAPAGNTRHSTNRKNSFRSSPHTQPQRKLTTVDNFPPRRSTIRGPDCKGYGISAAKVDRHTADAAAVHETTTSSTYIPTASNHSMKILPRQNPVTGKIQQGPGSKPRIKLSRQKNVPLRRISSGNHVESPQRTTQRRGGVAYEITLGASTTANYQQESIWTKRQDVNRELVVGRTAIPSAYLPRTTNSESDVLLLEHVLPKHGDALSSNANVLSRPRTLSVPQQEKARKRLHLVHSAPRLGAFPQVRGFEYFLSSVHVAAG